MTRAGSFQFRLHENSGIPVYRQLIDGITAGIATGTLHPGDQLPTVRQVAVDLAINPNTVLRAYRELEIRGLLDTQQGTGTFIAATQPQPDSSERARALDQLITEFVARAGAGGFSIEQVIQRLNDRLSGV